MNISNKAIIITIRSNVLKYSFITTQFCPNLNPKYPNANLNIYIHISGYLELF